MGYSALDYFDTASSTKSAVANITKYAFLSKYIAIVEPNAPMELALYSQLNEEFITRTYRYTVS